MKVNWLIVNLLFGCLVGWGLALVDAAAGEGRLTWRVACLACAVAILVFAHTG